MHAIIKTGGKQYRVKKGDIINVEKLSTEEGKNSIRFSEVLLVTDGDSINVGEPFLNGYFVEAELIGPTKGPKITSMKYKPRQYRKFGHRQHYTCVRITGIQAQEKKKSKESKESKE